MTVHSSKERFPVLEIAYLNLKHNAFLSLAAAAALCLLTPLFIGTANLDRSSSAMPLELFLSLTGVILFTPIFQPEQDREIADLVAAKYYRQEIVWLIRLGCSVLAVTAFLSLFTGYLKLRGCDTAPVLVFGTMADALFLGAMGMLTSSLADNTVIGYMPPLFYYALNIGMGQKLGSFYLFSMATGNYGAKLSLFAAGVLMTAAAFAGKRIKKRTQ